MQKNYHKQSSSNILPIPEPIASWCSWCHGKSGTPISSNCDRSSQCVSIVVVDNCSHLGEKSLNCEPSFTAGRSSRGQLALRPLPWPASPRTLASYRLSISGSSWTAFFNVNLSKAVSSRDPRKSSMSTPLSSWNANASTELSMIAT